MFNIQFNRQMVLQLAYALRESTHIDWVKSLIGSSFKTLEHIRAYRAENLYLLKFNPGKIYLEHFLNDRFDPVNRDIYIDSIQFMNPEYRYNEIEGRETYIFNISEGEAPQYLYSSAEINNQPGFIIYVPMTILLDTVMRLRIREAVDIYNVCTINYEIQNYE